MTRVTKTFVSCAKLVVLVFTISGFLLAQGAINPNAGVVSGAGVLNDHDGNRGAWSLQATLAGGNFSGTMTMTLGSKSMNVKLVSGKSYYENGRCVFSGEEGRNRFELRGTCNQTSFGPGTANGYFDKDRSFNGEMSGNLQWGKASVTAQPAAVLPATKLACAYRERIGGVVAGDAARYELRYSSMVWLTLSPTGTYRTNNASGSFVRQGDAIRFTTGTYAGALGRLRPDRGGEPAVYFELEENRTQNGVPIVDPYTTGCVRQR